MQTEAQYSLVQWVRPGAQPKNIGVFLYSPSGNILHWKFLNEWTDITSDIDDQEYLALLSADIAKLVVAIGPESFLTYLENTLSNAVQISDRRSIAVDDFNGKLEELFEHYIAPGNTRAFLPNS